MKGWKHLPLSVRPPLPYLAVCGFHILRVSVRRKAVYPTLHYVLYVLSHEEEGDGQDKEELVDLTTCVMHTIFLPYLSLSFFTFFLSFCLFPGHLREFILFSLVSLRLSFFWVISVVFWCSP